MRGHEQQQKRIDTLGFIKIKKLRASKETLNKMKRQPTAWERTFAKHTSEKGHVCRIYKERTDITQ